MRIVAKYAKRLQPSSNEIFRTASFDALDWEAGLRLAFNNAEKGERVVRMSEAGYH